MIKIISAEELQLEREIDTGTEEQLATVKQVIKEIRTRGDKALREYTAKWDGFETTRFRVTESEIQEAYEVVEPDFLNALRQAKENIMAYHEHQKRQSYMMTSPNGTILGQIIRPLQRVGFYCPGGTAAYPSSVLMNVIPALIAGVPEKVVVSPVKRDGTMNPNVLVAAKECGVEEIYKIGGSQAVAALAYGTESIPAVDKMVGPGNIYVALAKREVFGKVDIDMIAGPSEIVVIADDSTDPDYVAADMLSQAEHDPLAQAILITPSQQFAVKVQQQIEEQLVQLPRQKIARASIEAKGMIIVVSDLEEAITVSNQISPEHLELLMDNALNWVGKIVNAGAIFVGPYSPEPVGDYFAGPNHVLPTSGTAKFSSPLNVDHFIKKSSLISYSKEALFSNADQIMTLAEHEGLQAHARAIEIRLRKEGYDNARNKQ